MAVGRPEDHVARLHAGLRNRQSDGDDRCVTKRYDLRYHEDGGQEGQTAKERPNVHSLFLERFDFRDLGHVKTKTVDLSIGVILQKNRPGPCKLSTILTPGPGSDDLEGDTHPAPRQRRGVDHLRSFELLLRLTPLDIEKPDLRSGNLINPLLNIPSTAKNNRSNLFVVMRRYFRNHIRRVKFHHLINEILASHFFSFKGQGPAGEVIQAGQPILSQL